MCHKALRRTTLMFTSEYLELFFSTFETLDHGAVLTITVVHSLWPTKSKILPSKGILEIHTVEAPFPKGVAGMMVGRATREKLGRKMWQKRWLSDFEPKVFLWGKVYWQSQPSGPASTPLFGRVLKQTQEQWRSSQHRWVASGTNCPSFYYYYFLLLFTSLENTGRPKLCTAQHESTGTKLC